MIELSAQGATRLMEALEKLSEWAGSSAGSTPSGPPSAEVVQAFEEAMNMPSASSASAAPESVAGVQSEAQSMLPGPAESMPSLSVNESQAASSLDGGHVSADYADVGNHPQVDAANQTQGTEFRSDGVQGTDEVRSSHVQTAEESGRSDAAQPDHMQELSRLLEQISQPGATLTPDILYHTQYLMGMLKMQTQAGLKSSQSVSQGMENVLKQQG